MKLDRTQFPPLSAEDFQCEYFLTAATYRDFMELMELPPYERPGSLRIKVKGVKKIRKADAERRAAKEAESMKKATE